MLKQNACRRTASSGDPAGWLHNKYSELRIDSRSNTYFNMASKHVYIFRSTTTPWSKTSQPSLTAVYLASARLIRSDVVLLNY